jgi:hypothetical protein
MYSVVSEFSFLLQELKWIFKKCNEGGGGGVINWIHLVQDTDRWQAVLNAVMNLRVP